MQNMVTKSPIFTDQAPKAIGAYSQAIKVDKIVYLSGQIPLNPQTMEIISDDIKAQALQVFQNMRQVCMAAGGNLDAIVKLTIFLTDLSNFAIVNDAMSAFFKEPYPARSTIEVSALPKGAQIEIEAIMSLE